MKRLVISLIILLLVFSISATAVFAGSATFTGTLDPSDPRWKSFPSVRPLV